MATLTGTSGADTLAGGSGDDQITGLGGDDLLTGGGGSDSFQYYGTTNGFDTIDGGLGVDEIRATAASTVIGIASFTGIEAITAGGFSNVTIKGTSNGDNFDFSGTTITGIKWIEMGSGNDTAIGSAGDDVIYGDDGNDSLDGGSGNDTIRMYTTTSGYDDIDGGSGNDTISATGTGTIIGLHTLKNVEMITTSLGAVTISGSSGDDNLNFAGATITNIVGPISLGAGNDTFVGTENGDWFDGGAGDDDLNAEGGIDTVTYASAAAAVSVNLSISTAQNTLGAGTDILRSVENASGSAFNDTLTGSTVANSFQYSGSSSGFDAIDGGSGTDEIRATAAFTVIGLSSLTSIETITGGGFSDVTIKGTSNGDNFDFSGSTITGIKWIELGAGNDTAIGSASDDVIYGDDGNDSINSGSGNDTIRMYTTTSGYDDIDGGLGNDTISATGTGAIIGLHTLKNVELITTSLTAVTLVGSSGDDNLDFTGTTITNIVGGIQVGSGNDTVIGTGGSDTVVGGAGTDVLTGGAGADVFDYNAITESAVGSGRDILIDFTATDRIDLSNIDANSGLSGDQAFSFIGTTAFSSVAGQLRYDTSDPTKNVVMGDTNGDSVADFEIELTGSLTLFSSNFVL